jgi:hypothetical protein
MLILLAAPEVLIAVCTAAASAAEILRLGGVSSAECQHAARLQEGVTL